jgi:glycerol-3-phosphate acyltransferase PlsY
MTGIINIIIIVVLSYLIGSIPTAFLFGKILKGIDIRQHGSGNVGATNAFRILGKGPGTAVLVIDMLKGFLPVVFLAGWLHPGVEGSIAAAVGAVCGHNWTCFLAFRGGKGVATSVGVLMGLTAALPAVRWPVGLCLLTWVACFLSTGYISAASISAAIVLPVMMVVFVSPFSVTLLSILFCILVILRHRPNIQRLLTGQENRVALPFHKKK